MINDRKLPGLARALDDEAMRPTLSAALGEWLANGNQELTQVRPHLLKHTPGKRCVVKYQLELAGKPPGIKLVIGKLYRKDRGAIIFENLQKLWQAAHDKAAPVGEPKSQGTKEPKGHGDKAPMVFGMPEPLAYLPELGMVLQTVVPGKLLADFSPGPDLGRAIRLVARNLAALHGLCVAAGEKKTMADHIAKYCHPGPQALMEAFRDLAPLVERILNRLTQDESLQHAPMCPVHGDLGLAQIFVTAGRAFFIDFDGFCFSHAALDLSNFLIALRVHFGAQGEELAGIFLEAYLQNQTPEKLAGLELYHALIYLRRAMICFRQKNEANWRQQVRLLLEAATNECGTNRN